MADILPPLLPSLPPAGLEPNKSFPVETNELKPDYKEAYVILNKIPIDREFKRSFISGETLRDGLNIFLILYDIYFETSNIDNKFLSSLMERSNWLNYVFKYLPELIYQIPDSFETYRHLTFIIDRFLKEKEVENFRSTESVRYGLEDANRILKNFSKDIQFTLPHLVKD
jgi:hypothetical protein